MQTHLTAVQINCLAQRLSEAPLGRSATLVKGAERFLRLLQILIGQERAAVAVTSILSAATFEQAEARLTLILTYGNTEDAADSTVEAVSREVGEPRAAGEPKPSRVSGKRRGMHDQAAAGILPPAPDFSRPTHARFRNKLAQIVALAERGDIAALQAFEINPVSSSPKAMACYRDLCVVAITSRAPVTTSG